MSQNTSPLDLQTAIQNGYLRYFDTAFWLRDEKMMAEREKLLSRDGYFFRDMLIEPIPTYPPGPTILEACKEAQLSTDIANQLANMLFESNSDFELWHHQAQSLRVSLERDKKNPRNLLVTSGTGSGKTECFLMPVFARLLLEAQSWSSSTNLNRWWASDERPWRDCRCDQTREAAVRAMILYPTNALVEDQVSRLRRAIEKADFEDSTPKIFFGRYTGATLGFGDIPPNQSIARKIASELLDMENIRDSLSNRETDITCQFPDPRRGELLTRWDMLASPPDILVTNYSMLNVILMRQREESIFESTRRWLEASQERCFTLIVDELHTYRGTQGTEVAFTIRNLLRRLGLTPDSPQLRIVATSASLENKIAHQFAEQFFGVPAETFEVIDGAPLEHPPLVKLPKKPFTQLMEEGDLEQRKNLAATLCSEYRAPNMLAAACVHHGISRATPLPKIEKRVFAEDSDLGNDAALMGLLWAVSANERTDEDSRFRAHLFFRPVHGLWACCNPHCSQVDSNFSSDSRQIGRLYATPRIQCECGSRVLELLYCYNCGEPFLGGFSEVIPEANEAWYLTSGARDSARWEQGPVFRRQYGQYMWYWPGECPTNSKWSHRPPGSEKSVVFRFAPAQLDPGSGLLQLSRRGTGTIMAVSGIPKTREMRIPALPEQCPRCGSSNPNRTRETFFRGIVRSPIRAHSMGTSVSAQILVDRLIDSLSNGSEATKTIVFTDSRDDAAATAAGLEINHFRDLLRQLIRSEARIRPSAATLLRDAAKGEEIPDEHQELFIQLKSMYPDVWASYRLSARGIAEAEDIERISAYENAHATQFSTVPWGLLLHNLRERLVRLGVNPAGPHASRYKLRGEYWWRYFPPPNGRAWQPLDEEIRKQGEKSLHKFLTEEVTQAIFDRAGRDLESIGLGNWSCRKYRTKSCQGFLDILRPKY